MEKVKAFGRVILAAIQDHPKGALIVAGVILIAVIVLMWG